MSSLSLVPSLISKGPSPKSLDLAEEVVQQPAVREEIYKVGRGRRREAK
jgi:hypothetical protein